MVSWLRGNGGTVLCLICWRKLKVTQVEGFLKGGKVKGWHVLCPDALRGRRVNFGPEKEVISLSMMVSDGPAKST